MSDKAQIKYMRIQPVNGRLVAYAQLFDKEGKLFPTERGAVDAPLAQVIQFCLDEDFEVENAEDVLFTLVRDHHFAA